MLNQFVNRALLVFTLCCSLLVSTAAAADGALPPHQAPPNLVPNHPDECFPDKAGYVRQLGVYPSGNWPFDERAQHQFISGRQFIFPNTLYFEAKNTDYCGGDGTCRFYSGIPGCYCANGCALHAQCGAPYSACGTTCSDLANDPRNCGACGNVCASGACENSMCKCDPPCGDGMECHDNQCRVLDICRTAENNDTCEQALCKYADTPCCKGVPNCYNCCAK